MIFAEKPMQKYWPAIKWWELRRIPFSLALLFAGSVVIFVLLEIGGHYTAPGEDIIEPILLILGSMAYVFAANAFYTLGWISEILWCGGDVSRTTALRPRIFWLGLFVSVFVTLSPAVILPTLWFLLHK